jgi:hypothetical protein
LTAADNYAHASNPTWLTKSQKNKKVRIAPVLYGIMGKKRINKQRTDLGEENAMQQLLYYAITEMRGRGCKMHFPDLPGCKASGSDVFDATKKLIQKFYQNMYAMIENGEQLPAPSDKAEIIKKVKKEDSMLVPFVLDVPGDVREHEEDDGADEEEYEEYEEECDDDEYEYYAEDDEHDD